MHFTRYRGLERLAALLCAMLCVLALSPTFAQAEDADSSDGPVPIYQSLDELEGKKFAYVNGSVYNQKVAARLDGTSEQFYASLADCVAAVEAGKADAAVQLSYCCQLVVNRKGGTVALLPEGVSDVEECFFFPHGDPLVARFNEVLDKFEADGTIEELTAKWVGADDTKKTLPEQDWDAPNGTLKFATSGVLEPYSYVGNGKKPMGYDVELALLIAKELGYHLKISTITMDAIFASVESGKVDFGGSLTRTDERAEIVDFTHKVMPDHIAVIVPAEKTAGATTGVELEISSFDELDGKVIGALNGSVYDQIINDNLKGSFNYMYFNNISDIVAALKAGKVDAMAADEPVSMLAVNQNEGIGIIPGIVVKDDYGFFFKKESPLVEQFNKVILDMEADGTLDELKAKWTGSDKDAKTLPEQDWETPNGTLTMVTTGQVEPISYMDGSTVTGYDIEVALLACKELGYGLELTVSDFSSVLAAVTSGKADFGGGGVSITEERSKSVDFAVPDYRGSLRIVVRTSGGKLDKHGFIDDLKDSFNKTFIEEDRWQLIVNGLIVTIAISVIAGFLGTLLGFATVLMRRKGTKWVSALVDGYQALMGGIPLVVVLMVLYYVVFGSVNVPGVLVAILAFTLSFGSTAGTTMWTAVSGMDIIQEETGMALGFTRQEVFKLIIFPQAATQFLPQLVGQFVSLVKETSIVGYIAVQDLTRASDLIRSRTMDAFFPLISTAIIYFLFCRILAWALGKLAAKLDSSNKPRKIEGVE